MFAPGWIHASFVERGVTKASYPKTALGEPDEDIESCIRANEDERDDKACGNVTPENCGEVAKAMRANRKRWIRLARAETGSRVWQALIRLDDGVSATLAVPYNAFWSEPRIILDRAVIEKRIEEAGGKPPEGTTLAIHLSLYLTLGFEAPTVVAADADEMPVHKLLNAMGLCLLYGAWINPFALLKIPTKNKKICV